MRATRAYGPSSGEIVKLDLDIGDITGNAGWLRRTGRDAEGIRSQSLLERAGQRHGFGRDVHHAIAGLNN